MFEEQPAHLRRIENDPGENGDENTGDVEILHSVVRMEGNAILGNTHQVTVLLDLDAIGIIRTRGSQGGQMQHHQAKNGEWHRDHMQGKEAVQCCIGNHEITLDPGCQVFSDHGDRAKQGNDDLSPPIRHLSPRQEVTHEGFSHQQNEDDHAKKPEQFTWLLE